MFEPNGTQLVDQKGDDLSAVEWTKFNLDTGAAQTAIPIAWDSIRTEAGGEVTFKTASGELVQSEGTGVYFGTDENGTRCKVSGPRAGVHKPLVSAHKCLSKGRLAVLDEHGGYIVPLSTAAGKDIQRILKKSSNSQKKQWLKLYQERGVYNFYLQGEAPASGRNKGFGRQRTDA